RDLDSFPTRRSSDLRKVLHIRWICGLFIHQQLTGSVCKCTPYSQPIGAEIRTIIQFHVYPFPFGLTYVGSDARRESHGGGDVTRSEEHTSELQSREN